MKKWMKAMLMVSLAGSSAVRAQSLTEIADFADRICSNTVQGEITRDQIKGKIDANLPELAKVLGLKVEADGSLTHDKTTYSGIPLQNLPASIPTPAQCKTEVARMLISERAKIQQSPQSETDRLDQLAESLNRSVSAQIETFHFLPGMSLGCITLRNQINSLVGASSLGQTKTLIRDVVARNDPNEIRGFEAQMRQNTQQKANLVSSLLASALQMGCGS